MIYNKDRPCDTLLSVKLPTDLWKALDTIAPGRTKGVYLRQLLEKEFGLQPEPAA
jgi:hypothetical protein